jgi:hypothetical protein
MSNSLATCSLLAKEALAVLENMLSFASNVNRDWEDEFTSNQKRGYSPGTTINIKKPPRYTYRAGRVANPQATIESTVPLTLSQGGGDMNFTGVERTVSIQQMEGKVQAMMATVANEVDRQGCQLARIATFNAIGTPGTPPNTQALALQAILGVNQRMDEMGAPRDKQRALIMNPAFNAAAVQGLAGMFNAQDKLGDQYDKGMLVNSLGLTPAMDQNIDVHTNGTAVVGTNTVNGASQQGSTITVNALNGTVTRGTKITFANVFAVNPQSRVSTGTLAQFTVTADAANAATSLLISPAIVNSGCVPERHGVACERGDDHDLRNGLGLLQRERRLPQGRLHACDGPHVRAARRQGRHRRRPGNVQGHDHEGHRVLRRHQRQLHHPLRCVVRLGCDVPRARLHLRHLRNRP